MLTPAQLMEQRPGFVPVTRSEIAAHLRAAGVRVGGLLMVHVRLSALGGLRGAWLRWCMPSPKQWVLMAR
jgi:hypothetical protein